MTSLSLLLSLPFAKQVLAFEAVRLGSCRAVYHGILPYADMGSGGYVRWALDSIERLLSLPHEEELDEALMRLAIHTGEPQASLNAVEIRDDLRWLCARLGFTPPTGRGAVTLCLFGILEDMARGVIPAKRARTALHCMHELMQDENFGEALNRLDDYYWQLEELDELSLLGLTKDLPDRRMLMRAFHEEVCHLATKMEVALVPGKDGERCLCVLPRRSA